MVQQIDIISYLRKNKEHFREKFDIVKIGVFGSYARNEQNEESDIDILIEMPVGTSDIFDKRLEFKEMLSKYFSIPVDVCHERAIKPIFRDLILKDAIYV